MVAYAYIRCSTGQQVESGLGLEAQAKSVEEGAKRLGLELAESSRTKGYRVGFPSQRGPAFSMRSRCSREATSSSSRIVRVSEGTC